MAKIPIRVTNFGTLNDFLEVRSFGLYFVKCNNGGNKSKVNKAAEVNVTKAINPKFCRTTESVNNRAVNAATI